MSIFRPIASAESVDNPDHLAALLKACGDEWFVNEKRHQWVGSDEYVGTRDENRDEARGKSIKEVAQLFAPRFAKHSESRKWASPMSIE